MKKVYMNLKPVVVLFVLACYPSLCKGQNIDYVIHAGMNVSNYVDGDKYQLYESSAKIGLELGVGVRTNFDGNFFIQSGINILQSGGNFAVMSPYVDSSGQLFTEFPEVNTKMLSLEIPLSVGYNVKVGKSVVLSPSVGVYYRYNFASIKDKVNDGEKTEKWDCFKDFAHGAGRIDPFRHHDLGALVRVDATISRHYCLSLGYQRGLIKQSQQYGLKNQTFTLSAGYIF